jgi:hypothetical protein
MGCGVVLGKDKSVEYKAFVFGNYQMEVPNFTMQVVDTKYPQ